MIDIKIDSTNDFAWLAYAAGRAQGILLQLNQKNTIGHDNFRWLRANFMSAAADNPTEGQIRSICHRLIEEHTLRLITAKVTS